MDQLKGAFNSFAGGSGQNQQHNQQPQGQGYQQSQGEGYQQRPGGAGGFDVQGAFNSFTGGNNQHQQQPQSQGYQQNQGGDHQQRPSGSGGFDFQGAFNSFTGGNKQNQQHSQQQYGQQPQGEGSHQQTSGGGFLSGLGDKFNTAAGGGRESEKNEDYLDKGVDFVQEKFLGQGPQDNESAIEQAKDEQISDFIRDKYKTATGKEFFIKDKETKF